MVKGKRDGRDTDQSQSAKSGNAANIADHLVKEAERKEQGQASVTDPKKD